MPQLYDNAVYVFLVLILPEDMGRVAQSVQ